MTLNRTPKITFQKNVLVTLFVSIFLFISTSNNLYACTVTNPIVEAKIISFKDDKLTTLKLVELKIVQWTFNDDDCAELMFSKNKEYLFFKEMKAGKKILVPAENISDKDLTLNDILVGQVFKREQLNKLLIYSGSFSKKKAP